MQLPLANRGSDPAKEHKYAQMDTVYNTPVVVLEHSDYIASIRCTGRGLQVTFTTASALNYAQLSWKPNPSLVFTTHSADCGDGNREHYKASAVTFDANGLTCDVTAQKAALEQVVDEVDLS